MSDELRAALQLGGFPVDLATVFVERDSHAIVSISPVVLLRDEVAKFACEVDLTAGVLTPWFDARANLPPSAGISTAHYDRAGWYRGIQPRHHDLIARFDAVLAGLDTPRGRFASVADLARKHMVVLLQGERTVDDLQSWPYENDDLRLDITSAGGVSYEFFETPE